MGALSFASAAFGFPIVRIRSIVSPASAGSPASARRRSSALILSVSAFLSVRPSARPSARQCTLNVDDSGRGDNEGKKERTQRREREGGRERCYRYLHRFAALALSKPELARARAREREPAVRPRELLQRSGKTSWSGLCG